jgi:hypothetical protein
MCETMPLDERMRVRVEITGMAELIVIANPDAAAGICAAAR